MFICAYSGLAVLTVPRPSDAMNVDWQSVPLTSICQSQQQFVGNCYAYGLPWHWANQCPGSGQSCHAQYLGLSVQDQEFYEREHMLQEHITQLEHLLDLWSPIPNSGGFTPPSSIIAVPGFMPCIHTPHTLPTYRLQLMTWYHLVIEFENGLDWLYNNLEDQVRSSNGSVSG